MLSIFHEQGTAAKRQIRGDVERPSRIIKRNIRRDPGVQPGDEIYDRARIIFSRARQSGRSRAASIF